MKAGMALVSALIGGGFTTYFVYRAIENPSPWRWGFAVGFVVYHFTLVIHEVGS